jgi:hypothetical protein
MPIDTRVRPGWLDQTRHGSDRENSISTFRFASSWSCVR